ncbi:MAG: NDP-hexose 2,3-dehydratase family protein [Sediminibacterium sp.]|nr:NDP-hexose 2,3-dehydratase family protein [Sediminibacterium sp.]
MKPDQNNFSTSYQFLKSAFTLKGSFTDTEKVIEWLKIQNDQVQVSIRKTQFKALDQWLFNKESGRLQHSSGKYFSIDGIDVKTNWGSISQWQQPIINQPEIGYLGFIVKEFDDVLYFLLQAKIEPGNVNYVQLSPTLQATRSNYTQVHKGKKPLYLEYFQNAKPQEILLDQLQSEQGARFFKKRNRNIIIKINEDIPVCDNFIWLTLAQIKCLMKFDNIVNMDTRTVISGIPFGNYAPDVVDFFNFLGSVNDNDSVKKAFLKSALSVTGAIHSLEEIITFLTVFKSEYDLEVTHIPLNSLENWVFGESEIYHREHKYFNVCAIDVSIENREVVKWSQPMVEPSQEGLCAFICKEINGLLHFAVQAKLECGNRDIIEFAPTVQCLTGNYRQTKEGALPFLEYVLNARPDQIFIDSLQSEEGGRFFREQNRNMIVIAGDDIPVELPDNFIWMTLNQLHTFLKFNNYLNIQSRSLISAIPFI